MSSSDSIASLSPQGQKASAAVTQILGISETELIANESGRQLHRLIARIDRFANDRDAPVRELQRAGPFRHATLRRLVKAVSAEGDISQRMLTLRLAPWHATAWSSGMSSPLCHRASHIR